MTITLLAVSLNEQPLSQPITACFDANGGTIGRADHNTMALPDPERHISRLQAEIMCTGARYLIKNVGAANPIVVGGRSLSLGESAPLTDRDQIRIGGYLLQVVLDPDDDVRGADITRGRAAVAAGGLPDARPDARPREPAVITSPRPPAPAPIGGMADFGTPLSSSNPFADLMGSPPPTAGGTPLPPVSSGDTFADLLMPAPAGVRAGSSALGGAPASNPGAARLPDDFDPFAAPPPPARAPTAPPPAPGAGLFDDLVPSAAPASIDDAFGLRQAAGRDPLADFMAGIPPAGGSAPPASAGGLPTDPLALFGGSDRPAPSAAPAAANHTPDLMAGFVPPKVVSPPQAPPPPIAAPAVANPVLPTRFDWQVNPPATAQAPTARAPVPPVPPMPPAAGFAHAPSGASELDFEFSTTSGLRKPTPGAAFGVPQAAPAPAPTPVAPAPVMAAAAPTQAAPAVRGGGGPSADALWHAFCQGAGVDPSLAATLDESMMRDIGALLRSAVDGTLQLMAVRATTKHELRAAVTIIQQRGNNPLKFSPDATTGLEQLLRPTMRGFLSGPAAMTDAMHDLVGHAIGTVAGMRAALDGMLERFAPGELESKLVGQSLLDSLLPMNRKAKLWELYLQHFESIREEAQEDFHSLFGKAFLAAYEQQLERLKQQQGGAAG
ncbi:MAG: type VI secretion system-associated FHA domain protein TagH [Burkholderiales bacterium]|nr:type VI secretion system-associated FHA domain protein TagH [Burkholderiales bacterium]